MENKYKHLVSLVMVITVGIFAVGSDSSNEIALEEVKESKPVYSVTAKELSKAYDLNEAAADKKYKGKVITVTGKIVNIGTAALSDDYEVDFKIGGLSSLSCQFSPSQIDEVSKLTKGQHAKVKGKVKGLYVKTVFLEGCVIL